MSDDTRTVAQLAYEAYAHTDPKSAPLPWRQLPAPMKRAWCVAVRAVRLHDLGKASHAQDDSEASAHR